MVPERWGRVVYRGARIEGRHPAVEAISGGHFDQLSRKRLLEERTVPSPFGFGGFFGGFGGFFGRRGITSVPAQDARQVAQAFGTFPAGIYSGKTRAQFYCRQVRLTRRPTGPHSTRPSPGQLGMLNASIDARDRQLAQAAVEPGHVDSGRASRHWLEHPPDLAGRDPDTPDHRLPLVLAFSTRKARSSSARSPAT